MKGAIDMEIFIALMYLFLGLGIILSIIKYMLTDIFKVIKLVRDDRDKYI